MSRRLIVALVAAIAVLAVAAGALVHLDQVSEYAIQTEPIEFTHDGDTLSGTLALPPGNGLFGLVAFIHGDGPIDADHDGGYLPMWEVLAAAGYASISWDKPGVGDSTGNWEHQSMSDRADEVIAAIHAVHNHPSIDLNHVGLIAFSQAGWPLPLVAAQYDIEFAIAVSPAINWRQQGLYDLDTYLTRQDASREERRLAHDYNLSERELADANASYAEYLDFVDHHRPAALERFDYFEAMTPDRWQFVRINTHSDAANTLSNLHGTPVLLQLGERDIHVDINDTENGYRSALGDNCLRVDRYPNAGHSLLRAELEDSPTRLWVEAVWQPREIYADSFLTRIQSFADHHECTPAH